MYGFGDSGPIEVPVTGTKRYYIVGCFQSTNDFHFIDKNVSDHPSAYPDECLSYFTTEQPLSPSSGVPLSTTDQTERITTDNYDSTTLTSSQTGLSTTDLTKDSTFFTESTHHSVYTTSQIDEVTAQSTKEEETSLQITTDYTHTESTSNDLFTTSTIESSSDLTLTSEDEFKTSTVGQNSKEFHYNFFEIMKPIFM